MNSPARLPWEWKERADVNARNTALSESETREDIGVFSFARRTAELAIPFGIVAGLFGLWMNAKVAEFTGAINVAVEKHALSEEAVHRGYVSSREYELMQKLWEERNASQDAIIRQHQAMIEANTRFLDRIGAKVGLQRVGARESY